MSGAHDGHNPPETPNADNDAGSGEGADSALQALIRKRKQHLGDSSDPAPSHDGAEPAPPANP